MKNINRQVKQMYITFRNKSASGKMIVFIENQKYIIDPESSVEVFCQSKKILFEAQNASLGELTDALNELDEEAKRIEEAEKSGFVDDDDIDWEKIGVD